MKVSFSSVLLESEKGFYVQFHQHIIKAELSGNVLYILRAHDSTCVKNSDCQKACFLHMTRLALFLVSSLSLAKTIKTTTRTVHTFDIRERNDRNVVFADVLLKHANATFHHWGIGTPHEAAVAAAEAAAQSRKREPRMKTLQQTIRELNHSHQTIDIFKIDCESCEWFQYTTWLEAMRAENVTIRQILVETHHIIQNDGDDNDADADVDAHNFFMTLHDAGYVIFSKEPNYEAEASCVEYAFIQLSPDFFVNGTLYHERGYATRTQVSS